MESWRTDVFTSLFMFPCVRIAGNAIILNTFGLVFIPRLFVQADPTLLLRDREQFSEAACVMFKYIRSSFPWPGSQRRYVCTYPLHTPTPALSLSPDSWSSRGVMFFLCPIANGWSTRVKINQTNSFSVWSLIEINFTRVCKKWLVSVYSLFSVRNASKAMQA